MCADAPYYVQKPGRGQRPPKVKREKIVEMISHKVGFDRAHSSMWVLHVELKKPLVFRGGQIVCELPGTSKCRKRCFKKANVRGLLLGL